MRRSSPCFRVSSAGKNTTSCVGSIRISPVALWLHANADSWNRRVSVLSLRSVSSAVVVRPER
jgi:hypothetical protein